MVTKKLLLLALITGLSMRCILAADGDGGKGNAPAAPGFVEKVLGYAGAPVDFVLNHGDALAKKFTTVTAVTKAGITGVFAWILCTNEKVREKVTEWSNSVKRTVGLSNEKIVRSKVQRWKDETESVKSGSCSGCPA